MTKYLWLIPFISFLGGYVIMTTLYKERILEAPVLVGLPIQEALARAGDEGLGIRLVAEKEDPELPSGTILSQNPLPHTKIKSHQQITCVVSKIPSISMPDLIGKTTKEIKQELDDRRMNGKIYYIVSSEPVGRCVGQDPAPGSPVANVITATLYISKGPADAYVLPDLTDHVSSEAQQLLVSHGITVDVVHENGTHEGPCDALCMVASQRPRAGSIVQPYGDQHTTVHLTITRRNEVTQPIEHEEETPQDIVTTDN